MYETFSVLDVLLDEENPRFADGVASQAAAIKALLAQGPEKLLALARDIAVRGELDPINPPIVMKADGKLVVLEGNRRFAAMKLLRKPELAEATATQRSLKQIRAAATAADKDPDGPKDVFCYVVTDRSAARRWIELRHTGLNEGVGTDPWNSYQGITFRRRPNTPEDRAWLLVRAVLATFADDAALAADVRRVRDEKFTNLARLLGRGLVRDLLALEFEDDAVTLRSDEAFYVDLLRTLFSDLVGMSVDEIKTAAAQDEYVKRLTNAVRLNHPEETGEAATAAGTSAGAANPGSGTVVSGGSGTPPTTGTASAASGGSTAGAPSTSPGPGSSANGAGVSTGSPGGGQPPTGRRKAAPKPEAKIFYGLTLRNVSLRTSTILKEAQKVKIDDAPSVCAVMVRIVIELVVSEVGVGNGWFAENESLRKKIRKALLQLDPDIENASKRNKDLEMAWVRSQASGGDGLAIDEMNAYVHNFAADPSAERVRALSNTFRLMLTLLDGAATVKANA
jgi:hypothetical protein